MATSRRALLPPGFGMAWTESCDFKFLGQGFWGLNQASARRSIAASQHDETGHILVRRRQGP